MVRKVRFGVFLPFYAFRSEVVPSLMFCRVRDVVLECERLGYDSVWLDDHLMFENRPILECWTTLAALSSVTSRVRLGSMVSCNSFRNPGLLAKMAASVDVVSGGRLEFGVGAGVQEAEHVAYGFGFPDVEVRVERLGEALEVVRRLWCEESVSYVGEFYRLEGAVCEPKPLQVPHPPVIVGGGSESLMLEVTSRYADRFDWSYVSSFDAYKRRLGVLEGFCEASGRDFGAVEKSCWLGAQIVFADNREKVKDKSVKEGLLSGPDECVRFMQPYLDLGVTYFMLFFGDLPSLSSLRLFAESVAGKI
jgi:alkanesulfonate monooxygenase SsuD/methylene tetrahydromethanopterin reductase-like flavin-dependent oxidoreductase (luciferase family)